MKTHETIYQGGGLEGKVRLRTFRTRQEREKGKDSRPWRLCPCTESGSNKAVKDFMCVYVQRKSPCMIHVSRSRWPLMSFVGS
jgi:hypothetical protein